MKIYLDDIRPVPKGWVGVRWPEEVIELLKTGEVAELSLDHDLGDDDHGTGYTVLLWIEEQTFLHGFVPPVIYIHSDNSGAKGKMRSAIESIGRFHQQNSARKAKP